MAMKGRGLSYAEAGVDFDAGDRLVEMIKPLVRSTAQTGTNPEIGGFGGLFGKLDPDAGASVVAWVAEGCRQAGYAGETVMRLGNVVPLATEPVGYDGRLDLVW